MWLTLAARVSSIVGRHNMRDAKSRSAWKRIPLALLKAYAGLCTLLVTAILALILWDRISTQTTSAEPAQGDQDRITSAELELKRLDLTLSYDLPKMARTDDGPLQIHTAGGNASQQDRAADGSQPSGAETNRLPEAADPRR